MLFWQQEGSRSKFDPQEGTCHFQVEIGGFLYAHPHQSIDPGCEKIVSKNAQIFPVGTVLFIIGMEKETLVGVLSNRPDASIKVQNTKSNKSTDLKAGEYAKSLDDGQLVKVEFDLEDFYKTIPLALGLGPDSKDENYVNRQEPAIKIILKKLRAETIKAIYAQDKSRPIAPIDWIPTPPPSDEQGYYRTPG